MWTLLLLLGHVLCKQEMGRRQQIGVIRCQWLKERLLLAVDGHFMQVICGLQSATYDTHATTYISSSLVRNVVSGS